MLQNRQFAEARVLYARLCAQDTADAESWFMLGAINGTLGHFDEAADCCRRAIALRPDYADAHYNLAQAYMHLNKLAPAAESFRAVVRLRPDHAEAWNNLGNALHDLRRRDEAIACYREALRLRPDFTGTRYRLAALGGEAAPDKPPAEYVAKLFDAYADRFEQQLVQELQYQTPVLLNKLMRNVMPHAPKALDVLDLGCGTGLCGPLLRDFARVLTGMDISAGMIEKARVKNVYDELLTGDITAWDFGGATYDLIVAADVFPYLGNLQPVFDKCRALLKPGAHFVFSAEASDETDSYVLRPTDRYVHNAGYIRALAARNGYAVVAMETATLRRDRGKPVEGYLCVLRRLSDADNAASPSSV